jgi:hypothetical protein
LDLTYDEQGEIAKAEVLIVSDPMNEPYMISEEVTHMFDIQNLMDQLANQKDQIQNMQTDYDEDQD